MESIIVFNPVAPNRSVAQQSRQTLESLAGKVVGFIDNAKPNFNYLVDDLAQLLVSKYGVGKIIKHRKRTAAIRAPTEVLQELSEQCDAVITGMGD